MKLIQDVFSVGPICVITMWSGRMRWFPFLRWSAHFTLHSTFTFMLDMLWALEATCAWRKMTGREMAVEIHVAWIKRWNLLVRLSKHCKQQFHVSNWEPQNPFRSPGMGYECHVASGIYGMWTHNPCTSLFGSTFWQLKEMQRIFTDKWETSTPFYCSVLR